MESAARNQDYFIARSQRFAQEWLISVRHHADRSASQFKPCFAEELG
jgi:hypothetical protein